jgi:hypothetical protein
VTQEVVTVRLIDREELKARLDRGDDFKLVLALEEWAYRAKHIPGTLFFPTVQAALRELKPEDDIVVYCSDPSAVPASSPTRAWWHGATETCAGMRGDSWIGRTPATRWKGRLLRTSRSRRPSRDSPGRKR